ncbi:MAG: hypothetical protein KKB51_02685 [Candidatus Riflebacteria bacterium]|nr:hypothetical protein [Candidatus Riflebacteria bacterium]
MNCDEIKNLLSECKNLADLSQMPDAAAHIKSCAGCRAALGYEEKLRQGFASIATEAPPPDLAARIMAIQAEQLKETGLTQAAAEPDWFDLLLRSLQGFPFKIAFAAGLTGFFAAILILHQPQLATVQKPAEIATRREQTAPAVVEDKIGQLAMKPEEKQAEMADKSMQLAMLKKSDQPEKADKLMPLAESASRLPATEEDSDAESLNEERIPGAMTFALDSSEDSFVPESSAGGATFADQPAASEPDMQLAMAPSENREMTKSVAPASPARFAPPPPVSSIRARMSASQVASEGKGKKFELSDEMFAETESSDPLAEELRELIKANAIDLAEGFISLDELAMRGYLPAEKLRRLRPPTGSGWYLQKNAGQLRIFLKKR